MVGNDLFFCEMQVGVPLRSLPEYLTYCAAVASQWKQEREVQTRRSMEAVEERRKAGLLPPADHKTRRRKAMQENDWWNAMNALGRLVFALERHEMHPEVAEHLRGTIALIKSVLPEEFSRKKITEEALSVEKASIHSS
jgi:hypothetical protein